MERYELPEGWEWKRLGDKKVLTDIQPGFACGIKDVIGGVPHLRMNNISKDGFLDMSLVRRIPKEKAEKSNKWLEHGDIIFNNTNSTELVGKTCIFPNWKERCTFSNHLTRLRCNRTVLLGEWLYICLRNLWLSGYFATNCTEFVGQSAFNTDKLKELEIPVPPLPEQHRIVTRIEELTHRVEETRKLKQTAVEEIGKYIPSALYRVFQDIDNSHTKPLGEVTYILGGSSIPLNESPPTKEDDRVFLMKVSDMNMEGNYTYIEKCSLETSKDIAAQHRLRLIPAGSVVIPKRGGAIATNKKRILTCPAALDPNLMGITPKSDFHIMPKCLYWWFQTINLANLQEDGGLPQVNKKHLDPLPFPILEEKEQRHIVKYLDSLHAKATEIMQLQDETETKLTSFMPALLAKAFRGEL